MTRKVRMPREPDDLSSGVALPESYETVRRDYNYYFALIKGLREISARGLSFEQFAFAMPKFLADCGNGAPNSTYINDLEWRLLDRAAIPAEEWQLIQGLSGIALEYGVRLSREARPSVDTLDEALCMSRIAYAVGTRKMTDGTFVPAPGGIEIPHEIAVAFEMKKRIISELERIIGVQQQPGYSIPFRFTHARVLDSFAEDYMHIGVHMAINGSDLDTARAYMLEAAHFKEKAFDSYVVMKRMISHPSREGVTHSELQRSSEICIRKAVEYASCGGDYQEFERLVARREAFQDLRSLPHMAADYYDKIGSYMIRRRNVFQMGREFITWAATIKARAGESYHASAREESADFAYVNEMNAGFCYRRAGNLEEELAARALIAGRPYESGAVSGRLMRAAGLYEIACSCFRQIDNPCAFEDPADFERNRENMATLERQAAAIREGGSSYIPFAIPVLATARALNQ
jgi:hypothetical protein